MHLHKGFTHTRALPIDGFLPAHYPSKHQEVKTSRTVSINQSRSQPPSPPLFQKYYLCEHQLRALSSRFEAHCCCPSTSAHQNMPPKRRQPKFKITWWMRFRSKVRALHTPLRLRGSIVRLRHDHAHPYLTLLKLFVIHLQLPSWNWSYDYPLPEPLAPKDILDNEDLFYSHHPEIFNLRYINIWRMRDTPLRSIYRLYEIFMTRESVWLRHECEYMWRQAGRKWSLSSIPDPRDPDPVRYAMLASIVEELVKAFNWRLRLGARRNGDNLIRSNEDPWPKYDPEVAPSWTASVPPIKEEDLYELPSNIVHHGQLLLSNAGCENFLRRNFDAQVGYLYTT